MMKRAFPYQCTPVAVGRLSSGVGVIWLFFHLSSVVVAEIHVIIEDRVTDPVQLSSSKAETGKIVLLADFLDLKYYLWKM